jgi:hypothetical protein
MYTEKIVHRVQLVIFSFYDFINDANCRFQSIAYISILLYQLHAGITFSK